MADMPIKKYDGFVDRNQCDLVRAMKTEIRELLRDFATAYDLEADPEKQVKNCCESILNLIFETKYEW